MLPADEGITRNEPLLPRSASFGQGRAFDPLKASGIAGIAGIAGLRNAFEGDALAIKSACMLAATCSLVVGVLGVLNPFSLLSPLHLLTCLYVVPLSVVSLALEVEITPLEPFYAWVTVWMRTLTLQRGRGFFLVVLGTLVTGLGGPLSFLVGLLDIAAGALSVWNAQQAQPVAAEDAENSSPSRPGSRAAPGDVPRLAFRRRVLYGMDTMDSAELVALCLELGVRLDARGRVAALAILDPQQDGRITEDAFCAWWESQRGMPAL